MSETWEIYKKTKHRVGFRPPDGRDFRLPRRLLPDAYAVGETVSAQIEQRGEETMLVTELGRGHTEVVQEVGPDPDPTLDRWLIWKVHADWTGITGAPLTGGQIQTTGKFKVPPELLPASAGRGDQCLVMARVKERRAEWLVTMG